MNKNNLLIIEPNLIEKNYWKDIWSYRELFYVLSWRDLKVRYRQTFLGVLWSVIKPVLTIIIFYFVFQKIANIRSVGKIPYTLLALAGLIPWQFFSNSFSESAQSLIINSHLITKVYFPRMIIPFCSVVVGMVELLISFFLLIILFIYFNFGLSLNILFLPVILFLSFLLTFSCGLIVTALNVKYRDFKYIIPFAVQFGMYFSPIGYSIENIPSKWILIYSINPMVGLINLFRWSLLGSDIHLYFPAIIIFLLWTIILFYFSIKYFRNTEKKFADII